MELRRRERIIGSMQLLLHLPIEHNGVRTEINEAAFESEVIPERDQSVVIAFNTVRGVRELTFQGEMRD